MIGELLQTPTRRTCSFLCNYTDFSFFSFRRDCPKNPKSANFIRDNPCQIEGHDHDWVDCPDNPKSENYKPPKRRSKKPSKRTSTKETQEADDSDDEENVDEEAKEKSKTRSKKQEDLARKRREESRNLAKGSEKVQVKDEPVEPEPAEVIEEEKPKEFVPAPPPKVPAWSGGPPTSIQKTSLPSSEPADEAEPVSEKAPVEEAPIFPSSAATVAQRQVPKQDAQSIPQQLQVEPHDRSSFTSAQYALPTSSSDNHTAQSDTIPTQSTMQSQPILPPPNALFPGNSALFGESEGSAVYGSWNPPPMVLPSTYVDPWKPNPFAPTTSIAPSIGSSLGGIWSGTATKPSNVQVETTDTTGQTLEDTNKVAADKTTNSDTAPALNEIAKKEANGESRTELTDPVGDSTDGNRVGGKSHHKSKKPLRKPRPGGKGGKGKPGKGKPNQEKPRVGKDSENAEPGEPASTESLPSNDPSAPTLGVDKRNVADKSKKKGSGFTKCRIEGHDHLWKDCPNNTKSGKGKGSKFGFKKKPRGPKRGEKGNTSESPQSAAAVTADKASS